MTIYCSNSDFQHPEGYWISKPTNPPQLYDYADYYNNSNKNSKLNWATELRVSEFTIYKGGGIGKLGGSFPEMMEQWKIPTALQDAGSCQE